MNFTESTQYLYSLGNEVSAMKLGLENIRTLLTALGDPQNKYLKVQVAGTNGKGSVCAFLDSICNTAGIKTGTFTSPHLVSITERIRINGVDIGEDDFARHAGIVRETAENLLEKGELEYRPTFFEQVTAIALVAFAEAKVEVAILETGLGGRLDATTAANAEISAITRIDLDHQEYLGNTIEEIAAEKAAIIRADSRVCIGVQHPAAIGVIMSRCKDVKVRPTTLENAHWVRYALGYDFVLTELSISEVEIALQGEHQVENAALAILVVKMLKRFFAISDKHIRSGVVNARHPGRLEMVKLSSVHILLDGAHNPAGAETLAAYLRVSDPEAISVALLFGAMDDKDVSAMLSSLVPLATDVILTEAKNVRSMPAEKIAAALCREPTLDRVVSVPDLGEALDLAIEMASSYQDSRWRLVVVTGSLYLVGEVKKILNN